MIGAWDFPFPDDAGHPGSPLARDGSLLLTGWALASERPPTVRVYLDGKVCAETTPDFRREDIDIIFHSQKGKETPSGWVSILETERVAPGRRELEVKLVEGSNSQSLGKRVIEIANRTDAREASNAFLRTVLQQPDTHVVQRHQHYFGATPGAWRKNPSSAMGFSGQARELFRSCPATLVVGAGVNNTVDGVYQLDIFDYPNVDVATSGSTLPFLDASFDAVVCENVIEHVPDPKALVKEISRVLKPHGRIGINGTNLHFTHGFPFHYFNPTEWGMKLLLEEETSFSGEYHNASITNSLRMVLTYFENALSPAGREMLRKKSFGEIMSALNGSGPKEVLEAIATIAPEAAKALSTNVYFFGAKRE